MKYQKICAHCGHPFETNSPQKIYCNRTHYRPCPVCNTPVKMYDNDFSRKPACCSGKCRHILRKRHFQPRECTLCGEEFIPKSGVQLACDRTHYDDCEICGSKFIRTIANKIDGVTTCSRACTLKKMRRQSIEKYGVPHPMQSITVQQNFHNSMKTKYGVEHALLVPEFADKAKQSNLRNLGVEHACISDVCVSKQNGSPVSSINAKFNKMLNDLDIQTELEHKLLRYSYDIYVPSKQLLIEIDPTYTHNSHWNHYNKHGSYPYYHRDKTQLAIDNGYRCIHVFDWDSWDKVVGRYFPSKFMRASDFDVFRLSLDATNQFLDENDLRGRCRGQILCLGLVKDNEIYQVMTFGKSKFDKNYSMQILRMCTKLGYEIEGGYDLLSHEASKTYEISSVIAYCDRAKSDGELHESIGMKLIRTTPPTVIWSKGSEYVYDSLVRRKNTQYSADSLLDAGYLPVYDCGQRVYAFK